MPVPKAAIDNQNFQEFLVRLKEKDEKAWEKLNFVLLRIILKWLSDKSIYAEDAHEIYSNVTMVFIEKFDKLHFENFSLLKSYVFAIAENKVKEYYRYDAKNKKLHSLKNTHESGYVGLLSEMNEGTWNETAQIIYELFDKLSGIEKKVMQLLYKEEKSPKEIIAMLGLTDVNFRVIKHRALDKLKKRYNKLKKRP